MHELQQHEMQLEAKYSTGAEEWYCPVCGRRLVVVLPPGCVALALERGAKYILGWGPTVGTVAATKILLERGDEQAFHHGNAASGQALPELAEVEESPLVENSSVWDEWLEDIDFGET